jgi:response regulator RpfG family c-di-GMP phosphodiesterase
MRYSRVYCCSAAGTGRGAESPQPTILMIDDDPHISQAIKRRFSQYRVTLLQAHHGTHGIWLATTREPDVIITDLRMPQGRGQDVVAYLIRRPRTCRIPIIVLTGVYEEELRRRMLHLGVREYLTKPVSFEDLRKAIGRFIDLQRNEEADQELDEKQTISAAISSSISA